MNIHKYINEYRGRDENRSRIPPKKPMRRWVETRVCRCGECRFHPERECLGTGKPVQLYRTEARSA